MWQDVSLAVNHEHASEFVSREPSGPTAREALGLRHCDKDGGPSARSQHQTTLGGRGHVS